MLIYLLLLGFLLFKKQAQFYYYLEESIRQPSSYLFHIDTWAINMVASR